MENKILVLDVKTHMRLGDLFVRCEALERHNVEAFVAVELWLQDRVSSTFINRQMKPKE